MRQIWCRRWRRSTFILLAGLAFLCGVGLAHSGRLISLDWVYAGALGWVPLIRRRNSLALIIVILLGLSLGWWRGSLYMQKLADYKPLYGQKVSLTVQAVDDGVYGSHSQIAFDASNIRLSDGQQLAGKVKLSGFGLGAVFQGDTIQASGKLFPALGAYQGRLSFAELKLVAHHPSTIAALRRSFTSGMQSALPEPLAPFAMGLLIGQRATLPPSNKQDLLMVGLTHIIAVSGYNLTIMLEASRRLLAKRSKRLAAGLSLLLIALFLLFAGASASIVRAAIVSVLSILTAYYGRSFKPLTLLVLTAAITGWANPFYIWSDTSWYLSFLAFFGVMVVAPLLTVRLRPRWRRSVVVAVAVESVCAETMTLPFVMFVFGQISLIGLPANVLVVTLVPLAMLLSFIAGLAGMVVPTFSGWLAWPANVLLNYMLDTAHVLARVAHIFVQNLSLSVNAMLLFYGLVMAITGALWFKSKLKSAKITDKKTSRTTVTERIFADERTLQMVND